MKLLLKTTVDDVETKSSGIELNAKAVGESGTIEGYGSVFGVVDSSNEVVEPGAFAGSLVEAKRKGRTIKMLWQHDPRSPIGVWDDLAEDAKGLYVKGRLNLEKQLAREVHSDLKVGAVDGLSIGYRTIQTQPHDDKQGVLSLLKLDLREVSVVTFAANERARVETVKSACADLVKRLAAGDRLTEREFERLLKAEPFGLTNSQAERAVRIHLKKGQGEPDGTAEPAAFLRALLSGGG